jgi:hypothetical protein
MKYIPQDSESCSFRMYATEVDYLSSFGLYTTLGSVSNRDEQITRCVKAIIWFKAQLKEYIVQTVIKSLTF